MNNPCDENRESLLKFGWNEADRQRAQEVLNHLQTCPTCADAATMYDQVRHALADSAMEVSEAHEDAFHERMLAQLNVADEGTKYKWGLRMSAIAASILLGIIGFAIGRSPAGRAMLPLPQEQDHHNDGSVLIAFSRPEIAREAAAFEKVSTVFDRRATWLLVGDRNSDMGLAAGPVNADGQILFLRLAMLHLGQVISTSDLAIVAGQSAELNLKMSDGKTLHYEIATQANEPGRLMIGAQLKAADDAQTIAALATVLKFEPGVTQSAGTVATTSGNYELRIAFGQSGEVSNTTKP